MTSGIIFDIKRYAINDGPGIRTTIFLKGCPLSCIWCHNPESISFKPQKMFSITKCIGCKECVKACPNQACQLTTKGIATDQEQCHICGHCTEVCPTEATELSGQTVTVDALMKKIEQETIFFDQSGGGVTFSGGEPLSQARFLIAMLEACGQKEIHRVVDTSGYAPADLLLNVVKKTELVLYDLKVMDSEKHKQLTGVDNSRILNNLKVLAEKGVELNIRIPLIKGINDDTKNLDTTARFIAALAGPAKQVNLLPYHNIATNKYAKLGVLYNSEKMDELTDEEQQTAINLFKSYGLSAILGG
jgi:pyruvate formate lyase activating enzyme